MAKNLELREKISGYFNNTDSLIYLRSHWDNLDGKPVINDLTTGGSTNILSAEQGKVLKDLIDTTLGDIDTILDSILGV